MVGLAPQRRLHLQKSFRRAQNDFVRLFEILENTSDKHYRYLPQTHSPWTTNRRIDNMSLTLKGPVDLVRNFTVWPNRDLKSVSHLCVSP